MKNNLPKSLCVSGAGIAAVDGMYSRVADDDFNPDAPEYIKKGSWMGEPEIFHIKYVDCKSPPHWRIFRQ